MWNFGEPILRRLYYFAHSSLAAILSFGLLGCGGGNQSNTISISGSTTVLPAVSRAAETYQSGDIRVIVNAGGSGSGFNQLAEARTDIGMMSRDVNAEERAQYPDVSFREIVIGRDAVIPVVSSEIYDAGVTALKLSDLADIFSGRVDNWQAYGGPNRPIFVIDKEAGRGTRQVFMKTVMNDKSALAPGADLVIGANNEGQTAVTQSDSALSTLSHAWLNDNVKGLAIVMSDGRRFEPDIETIRAGDYPLSRDLTLVVRQDIRPEAQAFIDYLLGPDGQQAVLTSGYVAAMPK